ncbi:MAG: peptidylprolyl isomerase, partial [Clostridia bacterium]|nr:peptidylprolyl isomerase [Clostridia bacterium]
TAYINGTATVLDCAPCIVNDTTFVPVRFVTEALGYNVNFIPATRSVLICDESDIYVANNLSASFPEVEALTYVLSDDNLSSDELSLYTATYLIKLLVLENEANKLSLNIPDNKAEEILSTVVSLTTEFPVSKGGFARILERDALGTEYINHIKNKDEITSVYNENYACIKYVLISSGTETKNKSTANTVYRKATSNTNFNTLVNKYCEDQIMKDNPDGLIYYKDDLSQTFGEDILKLKENSVSKPIKTDYGYVVVKRIPLPEISKEIEEDICYNLYTLPLIQKTLSE